VCSSVASEAHSPPLQFQSADVDKKARRSTDAREARMEMGVDVGVDDAGDDVFELERKAIEYD